MLSIGMNLVTHRSNESWRELAHDKAISRGCFIDVRRQGNVFILGAMVWS